MPVWVAPHARKVRVEVEPGSGIFVLVTRLVPGHWRKRPVRRIGEDQPQLDGFFTAENQLTIEDELQRHRNARPEGVAPPR